MRYMGIDFGTKKIGLALSDEEGSLWGGRGGGGGKEFFGEISSRFEFSKAKSGLFFSEIKRYICANY